MKEGAKYQATFIDQQGPGVIPTGLTETNHCKKTSKALPNIPTTTTTTLERYPKPSDKTAVAKTTPAQEIIIPAPTTQTVQDTQKQDLSLSANTDIKEIVETLDPADDLRMYLTEIAKYPLLSKEQERELAVTMRDKKLAEERARAELENGQNLSTEEKADLQREIDKNFELSSQARNQLVNSNLRWVVHVAKEYMGRGLELKDRIQTGNIGLIEGVEKFDPEKGFRLITYATWWIRSEIRNTISEQARSIKLPKGKLANISRINKAGSDLAQELGRQPSLEEIAIETGISLEVIELTVLYNTQEPRISLDQPITGEEGDKSFLGDFIEDTQAVSPLTETLKENLEEDVRKAVSSLSPREQYLIGREYKLYNEGPQDRPATTKPASTRAEGKIRSRALRKLRSREHALLLSRHL